jgi:hypothetical protein
VSSSSSPSPAELLERFDVVAVAVAVAAAADDARGTCGDEWARELILGLALAVPAGVPVVDEAVVDRSSVRGLPWDSDWPRRRVSGCNVGGERGGLLGWLCRRVGEDTGWALGIVSPTPGVAERATGRRRPGSDSVGKVGRMQCNPRGMVARSRENSPTGSVHRQWTSLRAPAGTTLLRAAVLRSSAGTVARRHWRGADEAAKTTMMDDTGPGWGKRPEGRVQRAEGQP